MKTRLALLASAFIAISSGAGGASFVIGSEQRAQADIVFGNLGPSGTGSLAGSSAQISSTAFVAQGFTTPASGLLYLESIVLALNINSGSSNTRVQLFSNSSGNPGTLLEIVTGNVASVTSALYTFTLSTPFTLSGGTTYWVVASDPDAGTSYNWVFNSALASPSGQNESSYLWPSAGTLTSADSGSNWVDASTGFERFSGFYLNASDTPTPAIPEPGTWAAAALLAGGAAFARWRKRKTA